MKDLSNESFFTNWEPNHEKGIFKYVLKNTLHILLMIIISDFAFIIVRHPIKTETMNFMIYFFVVMGLFYLFSSILKWHSSEKRYKYIETVLEEIKHERE